MDYLIKLVRNNPCIYDTNNELYKNTAYKNKVWEKIGEDMQENSDTLKKKWKSLRDNYLKYKKTRQAEGQSKRSKWIWYDHLVFLDGLSINQTDTSIDNKSIDEEEEYIEPQIIPEPTPAPSVVKSFRKKSTEELDFSRAAKLLLDNKREQLDDIDLFFMCIAKSCKKFDPITQVQLKQRFMNIIIEAELNLYKKI
uniref:Putative transcription factor adf-1-like myzus persicae n=1 Tax=Xenopsylla cheopis TaxID=163159 RepID=A0A6M2DGX3_XENCH